MNTQSLFFVPSTFRGNVFLRIVRILFIIGLSGGVMADIQSQPGTGSSATELERLKSENELLEAEKANLETQKAIETLKKELEELQDDDKTSEKTKEISAQKELETAKKELLDAQQEVLKAKYGGISDSGIKGEVNVGQDAGLLEGNLLAYKAINAAAKQVALAVRQLQTDSNLGAEPTILIIPGMQPPDFGKVMEFEIQRGVVHQALITAKEAALKLKNASEKGGAESSVATVGIAIETLKNLLSYFRSDFTVTGLDLNINDDALARAIAGQDLNLPGHKFLPMTYWPEVLRSSPEYVVIPPFLIEPRSRLHAAFANIWLGVMPPRAMCGLS